MRMCSLRLLWVVLAPRRNYYGYALFFYHTINNWAGQRVHLPNRTLSFTPHHTAFNASGIAVLPILLGT